jgi:hypothetical protein
MMTHAQVIHAREVTERLREEEPPLGLDLREAVCHSCNLAFWVHDAFSWGVCPECLAESLTTIPTT